MRYKQYLIKQALGGSILSAQMTRPLTQPALGTPMHTLQDQRTLEHLFEMLPPSRKTGILRSVWARMRALRP